MSVNITIDPYKIPSTEQDPALILFMIDMSGSMEETTIYNGESITKGDAIALSVNTTLNDLVLRCRRGDKYKNYVYVQILNYNGKGVNSILDKYCSESNYCSINDLVEADTPIKTYHSVHMSDSGLITNQKRVKEFVRAEYYDNTPMYKSFEEAIKSLNYWYETKGRHSVPAIVINITDGEHTDASDKEMQDIATKLKSTKSDKGDTLLFNFHISSNTTLKSILFPSNYNQLEGVKFAKELYDMSSIAPKSLAHEFCLLTGRKECGLMRCMAYNISMSLLLDLLQIGSISINR